MAEAEFEDQQNNKQEIDIKSNEDQINKSRSELINQLMDTAKSGQIEKVKYLIEEQKVDVNSVDNTKARKTALHYAAKYGKDTIVKYLIDSGAQKDLQDEMFGMTPLYLAVDHNQENAVKQLLSCGADCNTPSKKGISPLDLSARHNNFNITEILLAKGANINYLIPDISDYNTVLHRAALGITVNNNWDVVKLLLKQYYDVNKQISPELIASLSDVFYEKDDYGYSNSNFSYHEKFASMVEEYNSD